MNRLLRYYVCNIIQFNMPKYEKTTGINVNRDIINCNCPSIIPKNFICRYIHNNLSRIMQITPEQQQGLLRCKSMRKINN
jgi:hypothetical protein